MADKGTCSMEGCEKPVRARGICGGHYERWRKYGDPAITLPHGPKHVPAIERLLARLDTSNPKACWLFPRSDQLGYAHMMGDHRRQVLVHRLAYESFIGAIPDGLVINHRCHDIDPTCRGGPCDHRRCCNPSHLEAVTQKENVLGSPHTPASINLAKTHCPQNHPYDAANTYIRPDGLPKRDCRTCRGMPPLRFTKEGFAY